MVLEHFRAELVEPAPADHPAGLHDHRDDVRLDVLGEVEEEVVEREGAGLRADVGDVVGRVPDDGVEVHGQPFLDAPGGGVAQVADDLVSVVPQVVDQVVVVFQVGRAVAVAQQGAAGDGAGHLRLADDEEVLAHHSVPDLPLPFQRQLLALGLQGVEAPAEERIGDVERVEAGFGVDLQHLAFALPECLPRGFPLVDPARLVQRLRVGLVQEAPAADRLGEVSVDDAPRREHRLLVGIAEIAEDPRDGADALHRGMVVGGLGEGADLMAGHADGLLVVVGDAMQELLLGDAGGHELRPRHVIHQVHEVVDGDVLAVVHVGPVDEERQADTDAAQDGDGVLALLALLAQAAEFLLFLLGDT